ncbi:MAG: cyclase family protein [Actinobacteria bacterium]|nr:cyclase family protein [Actinomycetota bacterium]
MKIIDISGPIDEGMWNYGYEIRPFKFGKVKMSYAGIEYDLDSLENMTAMTGTYFETPGDYHNYTISDVPLEKLFMIDSYVLQMPYEKLGFVDGRPCIDLKNFKKAEKTVIPPGSGIILATGYGKEWFSNSYVAKCPFLSKAAMDYLIDKKPFIVVFDTPAAENDVHPENIFKKYFAANILSLTACVNLEKIEKYNVKLIVMPLNLMKVIFSRESRSYSIPA